jgi:hypothetical protein
VRGKRTDRSRAAEGEAETVRLRTGLEVAAGEEVGVQIRAAEELPREVTMPSTASLDGAEPSLWRATRPRQEE